MGKAKASPTITEMETSLAALLAGKGVPNGSIKVGYRSGEHDSLCTMDGPLFDHLQANPELEEDMTNFLSNHFKELKSMLIMVFDGGGVSFLPPKPRAKVTQIVDPRAIQQALDEFTAILRSCRAPADLWGSLYVYAGTDFPIVRAHGDPLGHFLESRQKAGRLAMECFQKWRPTLAKGTVEYENGLATFRSSQARRQAEVVEGVVLEQHD